MDENLERRIRKNQNLLITAGNSIRLFAIWNVLKVLLEIAMKEAQLKDMIVASGVEADHLMVRMVEITAVILVLLYAFVIFRVARCTIDEGKKIKKHPGFIVWAAIILAVTGFSIISEWDLDSGFTKAESFMSLVTDSVCFVIVIMLIHSVLFLRKHPVDTADLPEPSDPETKAAPAATAYPAAPAATADPAVPAE